MSLDDLLFGTEEPDDGDLTEGQRAAARAARDYGYKVDEERLARIAKYLAAALVRQGIQAAPDDHPMRQEAAAREAEIRAEAVRLGRLPPAPDDEA